MRDCISFFMYIRRHRIPAVLNDACKPAKGSTAHAHRFFLHFVIAALVLVAASASAETYILPIWAQGLEASDGTWWANATAVNPHGFPVTVQIVGIYPLRTEACSGCPAQSAPLTIAARESAILQPLAGQQGRRLIAGAVEVETSAPVHFHLVAYRAGTAEIRQRLDVAQAWLQPGTHHVSSVERGALDFRMNVFLVNPTDAPLTASIWTGNREENEVRAVVAPKTTAVVGLPAPRCGGVPCPIGDVYPPPLLTVHVEANGVFLASVSAIDSTWAMFSLADEAVGVR